MRFKIGAKKRWWNKPMREPPDLKARILFLMMGIAALYAIFSDRVAR